jgi:multidrug resistance efflux pump
MKLTRNYSLFFSLFLIVGIYTSGCSVLPGNITPTPLPATPTPFPPRTLTEARVIPVQNAALSFSLSGIVDEVLVAEGDFVPAGGVIARLKGIDRAQAAITQAEVLNLKAQKDMDDFLEKSKIASAEAQLVMAKAQIELQNARDARKGLDYQQVSNTTLDGMRATYFLALDEFKNAEEDYEPYKNRGEKDQERAVFLTKLSNTRLAKDRALFNLNKAMEMPDPEKIAKADARLSLAEAALLDAQNTYDKVKSTPDPEQMAILKAALINAKAQKEAALSGLHDLEITAPFSGTIISNDLKSGQAVSPSAVVMLGDITAWQVETTDLAELDIVNIQPGDTVSVTFDAIPDLKINGSVNRIKQLGQSSKGDITYTVTIDLENTDPRLLWNMKAFVAFDN